MKNSRTVNSVTERKRDEAEQVVGDLKGIARLSLDDRRMFALNLGKMISSLEFGSIQKATKEVFEIAELHHLHSKRTRLVRFEAEYAETQKALDLTAGPAAYIRLAEGIAQLRCNSELTEQYHKERKQAYRELIASSSYAPSFIPSNASDVSAFELLHEYASILEEAVATRTKISDLWKLLDHTPIEVTSIEENQSSNFDPIELVPASLRERLFHSFVKAAVFETSDYYDPKYSKEGWASPSIEVGNLSFHTKINAFILPEDLREDVASNIIAWSQEKEQKIAEWFFKHGLFDSDDFGYEYEYSEYGFGWHEVECCLVYSVDIQIVPNHLNEPKVEVWVRSKSNELRGPSVYYLNLNSITGSDSIIFDVLHKSEASHYSESQAIQFSLGLPDDRSNGSVAHEDDGDPSDWEFFELIFEGCDLPQNGKITSMPVAILPYGWSEYPELNLKVNYENKLLETNYHNLRGWVDDPAIAAILLRDEGLKFTPTIDAAAASASIFKEGSLGASLLNNARDGQEGNRITDQLIVHTKEICEAGLRYYEYLHESYRAALKKI